MVDSDDADEQFRPPMKATDVSVIGLSHEVSLTDVVSK